MDQIRIVNEEKQALIVENQNVHQQYQDLLFEYNKMEAELSDFLCFRSSAPGGYQAEMQQNPMFMDQIAQNTQKLVAKIDELEDLVAELKTKQTASEVADLKDLVSQLQLENSHYAKKIGVLQEARINAKDLFQANDMH